MPNTEQYFPRKINVCSWKKASFLNFRQTRHKMKYTNKNSFTLQVLLQVQLDYNTELNRINFSISNFPLLYFVVKTNFIK